MFVSVLSSWLSLFFLCSRPSSRYSVESSFRFYFLFPVKTMFCSLQFLSAFVFSSNLSLFSSSHSSFSSQFQTLPFPFSFLLSLFLVKFLFQSASAFCMCFFLVCFLCTLSSSLVLFLLLPHYARSFRFCFLIGCISFPREGRGEKEHYNKDKGRRCIWNRKNSEIAKRKVLRKVKKNKEKVTCKGKKTNRINTVMKNRVRVRYQTTWNWNKKTKMRLLKQRSFSAGTVPTQSWKRGCQKNPWKRN